MSTHWFLVWVPSAREERRSRSRTGSSSPRVQRSVSDPCKDAETQSEAVVEDEQTSPNKSFQITRKSDDVEETNDDQAVEDKDQLKERLSNEEETTEELGKETQKLFHVTKISEEQNCEVKVNESAEKSPSNGSMEDIEDTMDETQSLLDKTEKTEPKKKKKGVTLNVAPLATGEVDSESMPATPRTEVSTINSKEQVPLLEWEPKEEEVKSLLRKHKVEPVHVVSTVDGAKTQISFCVPFDQVEGLSLELQRLCGIGHTEDTSLSILPISMHCSTDAKKDSSEEDSNETPEVEAKVEKFYSSIKSRLLVSEVVARIQAGAEFSFDYLLLVILAGIIAFMGLLENSSVVLVASMLVSPIMGPILAGIFGGVIGDWSLAWKGIRHEVYSLFLCIFIGFVLGLAVTPFAAQYGCSQWPTQEMVGRGEWRSLWVGVLIAVPSGAGVALSVLGGNAGSLVGVAISASLLPPAVNCGIFWAASIVMALSTDDTSFFFDDRTQPEDFTNFTISGYTPRYDNDNMPLESFYLGLISLVLTLVNILCIILTGVLILRVKEVTSEKIPQKFAHFWTKDIREHRKDIRKHREYGEKIRKDDPKASDLKTLVSEISTSGNQNGKTASTKSNEEALEGSFLQSMFDRAAQDEDLINIRQWVAMPGSTIVPGHKSFRRPNLNSAASQIPKLEVPEVSRPQSLQTSSPIPEGNLFHFPSARDGLQRRRTTSSRLMRQQSTVNAGQQGLQGAYLDVPWFLQMEMFRSREMRRKLKETDV